MGMSDREAFDLALRYVEADTCVKFISRTSESEYMLYVKI